MKDDNDKHQEVAIIDEMKRRNRRRLVGAIVLVAFAIFVVPWLLEKKTEPLGDKVEIVIPPVAGTKLPNTAPPVVVPPPAAAPAVEAPAPVAEPSTLTPEAVPPVKETPKETIKETPKEPPKAPPKETPKKMALPPTVAFAKGTFSVQLAAFTDDKGANTLVNRVKLAGYPAYNEPTDTARGMAWRVRVGPYKTRDDAMTVLNRLKKDGYDGMVRPAR
ncbi:MAG: SPOR domain-containing protein [Betaproteobacteria bacterium]|nr:SPOR domain-containing protein [Betaproteobacteria bacterium]